MGEIGTLIRGNGMPRVDFSDTGTGCIHYGQIYTFYGTSASQTISFVPEEKAQRLTKASHGDLIITNTSENVDDVCKAVAWLGDEEIVTGGHACVFKHNQNPKYLSYYLQTESFAAQKRRYASGTKVIDVSAKNLAKIKVPIPSRSSQDRIVKILEGFDALVNDATSGIPSELAVRRQQREYYLEIILRFKELK